MTFIKQSEVPECGGLLMERLRAGTVGWVSENRCYLITLFSANRSSSRLVNGGYNAKSDYVRMCALKPNGDMHRMLERMRCSKDGSAAFVINELMDITTKHAGEFDIDMHIREFSRAMFDTTSLAIGAVADTKGRRGTTVWSSVTLMNFQKYKERQKDAV